MKIGDSLRRKIDAGIASSRVAVTGISESYLAKGWVQCECDGAESQVVSGQQAILPIWHTISKRRVQNFRPSLADKIARKTSNRTVEEIATEIIAVIRDGSSSLHYIGGASL